MLGLQNGANSGVGEGGIAVGSGVGVLRAKISACVGVCVAFASPVGILHAVVIPSSNIVKIINFRVLLIPNLFDGVMDYPAFITSTGRLNYIAIPPFFSIVISMSGITHKPTP
jgi:hypothetical protein